MHVGVDQPGTNIEASEVYRLDAGRPVTIRLPTCTDDTGTPDNHSRVGDRPGSRIDERAMQERECGVLSGVALRRFGLAKVSNVRGRQMKRL